VRAAENSNNPDQILGILFTCYTTTLITFFPFLFTFSPSLSSFSLFYFLPISFSHAIPSLFFSLSLSSSFVFLLFYFLLIFFSQAYHHINYFSSFLPSFCISLILKCMSYFLLISLFQMLTTT
jgi:hypothetical protein